MRGAVNCPRPSETYVLLAVKPSLVTMRPERAFLQTKAAMGKKLSFLTIFLDAVPVLFAVMPLISDGRLFIS